ncbi:MAG: putative quinol monooxygenase [Acidimicrobiales bacterium]
MILIAGTVRIDPASRDAAIEAVTEMMANSAKEDGCVSYDFSADFHDPGILHLFEEWETAESLQSHLESPHMKVYRAALAEIGLLGRNIHKYEASEKVLLP